MVVGFSQSSGHATSSVPPLPTATLWRPGQLVGIWGHTCSLELLETGQVSSALKSPDDRGGSRKIDRLGPTVIKLYIEVVSRADTTSQYSVRNGGESLF